VDAHNLDPETCDVCGRHMLSGERTQAFLTPNGERRAVCDLCRDKVKQAGWPRADDAAVPEPPPEPERQPRRRRDRGRSRRERSSRADSSEPPERRIRRALERFNQSEHRETVAGLTRSLGEPKVAAVTPAQAPEQVRLTVAWELSWYQWKVEFSGGDADVSSFRSGNEVGELGPADRAWNARASEDGRLQLGLGSNGDREAPAPDEPA
jgi:hypothetical protein